ncbi:hypothetical protein GHT07_19405 [Caenimonas koreensis DSM 17982]|uniref:Uncharacterized protein n=1 Tax=Caenimonas koreensis DSM 17982 TaxID=1121255 RepID=A0A844AYK9_9BURK|nr:hypothetical protein [Caenimonas koreensis]MRD49445.1 hypothetical protein [Caenimonas koreensis DSM 17982]
MISNELAIRFIDKLSKAAALDRQSIQYEIQEEWRFLLVLVHVSSATDTLTLRRILESAQQIAQDLLPFRDKEYSWMVNVLQDGAVVDSVFGGNRSSPRSGEI